MEKKDNHTTEQPETFKCFENNNCICGNLMRKIENHMI
jgi:hypothetical protein